MVKNIHMVQYGSNFGVFNDDMEGKGHAISAKDAYTLRVTV